MVARFGTHPRSAEQPGADDQAGNGSAFGGDKTVATIVIETRIEAPRELCFDLARDVEAHCETAQFTHEQVVAPGRTTGLLERGDLVVFEGTHFGLRLRLSARIVEMERPVRFIDEAVNSAFKRMRHIHEFRGEGRATVMVDTLEWEAPLGPLGRAADALFLRRHMHTFVVRKQQGLKRLAEERARQ